MGVVGVLFIAFLLPETLDTDLLRTKRKGEEKRTGWVWLNPLRGLALLRSPNILAVVSSCLSNVSVAFNQ